MGGGPQLLPAKRLHPAGRGACGSRIAWIAGTRVAWVARSVAGQAFLLVQYCRR